MDKETLIVRLVKRLETAVAHLVPTCNAHAALDEYLVAERTTIRAYLDSVFKIPQGSAEYKRLLNMLNKLTKEWVYGWSAAHLGDAYDRTVKHPYKPAHAIKSLVIVVDGAHDYQKIGDKLRAYAAYRRDMFPYIVDGAEACGQFEFSRAPYTPHVCLDEGGFDVVLQKMLVSVVRPLAERWFDAASFAVSSTKPTLMRWKTKVPSSMAEIVAHESRLTDDAIADGSGFAHFGGCGADEDKMALAYNTHVIRANSVKVRLVEMKKALVELQMESDRSDAVIAKDHARLSAMVKKEACVFGEIRPQHKRQKMGRDNDEE